MREVKFRGLTTRGWIYGYPYKSQSGQWWMRAEAKPGQRPIVRIKAETLGQFTGLRDKNGVEIYEGDVVKGFYEFSGPYSEGGEWVTRAVKYHNEESAFGFAVTDDGDIKTPFENYINFLFQLEWVEVIGNIYDHPHLLEAR